MSRGVLFLASALLTLGGCGVPLNDAEPTVRNRCESSPECGASGTCVDGRCVATSADLTGLILRIDVPSGASFGGGTGNLVFGADLDVPLQGNQPGGFVLTDDLVTTALVNVTGELIVDLQDDPLLAPCEELVREDGTFPLALELQPRGVPAGLSLESYGVQTDADAKATATVGTSVPRGRYDVYVVPRTSDTIDDGTQTNICRLPPTLLTNRDLDQAEVPIRVSVAPPATLRGSIVGFAAVGWTVDVVDNVRGRRISTKATITESGPAAEFQLRYWPQLLDDADIDPIVRLLPPEDARLAGMPTVLWSLQALTIFGEDIAIDLTDLTGATPVQVAPTVADAENAVGVPAKVTIQSAQLLDGKLGGNLSYKTTVETDAVGSFEASLLPGQYVFRAQPIDDAYAATSVSVEVTPDDLQGRTLPLNRKRVLSGTATTPTGESAFGIPLTLRPTATNTTTFLQNQLSVTAATPNATSGTSDATGGFVLTTDPGEFNLSLQPEAELPWSVVSRLAIADTDDPLSPLRIRISHPVVLQGSVRAPTGATIAGAVLRAYLAPPEDEDGEAPGVIQIAEGRSDAFGNFQLLLPTSIQASVGQE